MIFAADNQCSGSLKNESVEFSRVKRSHFSLWLVDFNPFCTCKLGDWWLRWPLHWVTSQSGDRSVGCLVGWVTSQLGERRVG